MGEQRFDDSIHKLVGMLRELRYSKQHVPLPPVCCLMLASLQLLENACNCCYLDFCYRLYFTLLVFWCLLRATSILASQHDQKSHAMIDAQIVKWKSRPLFQEAIFTRAKETITLYHLNDNNKTSLATPDTLATVVDNRAVSEKKPNRHRHRHIAYDKIRPRNHLLWKVRSSVCRAHPTTYRS